MDLGYIGLGKMGLAMVGRLTEKGHRVTAFDRDPAASGEAAAQGATVRESISLLLSGLAPPRLVWIMVPHQAVDSVVRSMLPGLVPDDTIIDGGNSHYKESMRRAADLKKKRINFLDAGVSGGPAGARNGACIMVGGSKELYGRYEQIFRDLSVPGGCLHVGASGAGHFVKMAHNGIEYGMMQALAEGFAVMKSSPFAPDLAAVAALYNHGSVIESRLAAWLHDALREHGQDLDGVSGSVSQSGEGLWTVDTARELGVNVPVIERSVEFRFDSQKRPSYAGKILSALRNQFGGHRVAEHTIERSNGGSEMKPVDLKTKIFLDGGDAKETREILSLLGFLDGQTTNPTLIAKNPDARTRIKAGRKYRPDEILSFYRGVVREISALIPEGSISLEVYADKETTAEVMLSQAEEMFSWIPNGRIKFPTSRQGLKAAEQAVKKGIPINMTLCFTQEQAAAVYAATRGAARGQVFVSPFIGRLDDRGENGMDLIANILRMYAGGDGHVEVLTASVRTLDHLLYALRLGSDIITAPFEILKSWARDGMPLPEDDYVYDHGSLAPIAFREIDIGRPWDSFDLGHELTDKGMERFSGDWNALIAPEIRKTA